MDLRKHVPVTVWHHGVDGLSRADFLAADHERDFDLPAAQVFEGEFELVALFGAGA
jgi:hypothetical protein